MVAVLAFWDFQANYATWQLMSADGAVFGSA
jgi:hypothetical protein